MRESVCVFTPCVYIIRCKKNVRRHACVFGNMLHACILANRIVRIRGAVHDR